MPGFVVNVADLLFRPGARRHVRVEGRLDGLQVVGTKVPPAAPVTVDTALEWVSEGILATGETWTVWEAECRRCLKPVSGEVRARFQELFEARQPRGGDGDSYRLSGDRIDLEPLAREALLLDLPLAPLCQGDCLGLCTTCGRDLNVGRCDCPQAGVDPRWAALGDLRLEAEED